MNVFNQDRAVRFGQFHVGEIPDRFDPVFRQDFRHLEGCLFRHGQNGNCNLVFLQVLFQSVHGQDRYALKLRADQVLLDIERRCQFHPAGPEAEVIHQRMPDVADADQDRPKASVHTEDRSNLFPQRCDIVSVSLLAEFPEAAEILPDL